MSTRSKVEVKGFEARHYDVLMNIVTLGTYPSFLRRAIGDIGLQEGDKVADFGAGTGRNALLMRKYIGNEGELVAFEIGAEMISKARGRFLGYDNMRIENQDIRVPLEYKSYFDVVFMSFVLHGFEQSDRAKIVENANRALKYRGRIIILDYSEFDIGKMNPIARYLFTHLECPLALEFASMDIKTFLSERGFSGFREKFYYYGYVRLLYGKKVNRDEI